MTLTDVGTRNPSEAKLRNQASCPAQCQDMPYTRAYEQTDTHGTCFKENYYHTRNTCSAASKQPSCRTNRKSSAQRNGGCEEKAQQRAPRHHDRDEEPKILFRSSARAKGIAAIQINGNPCREMDFKSNGAKALSDALDGPAKSPAHYFVHEGWDGQPSVIALR